MKSRAEVPSQEDVLDAFAVEPQPGRETLERYLREYPQYAEALVDLSRELSRLPVQRTGPLSANEEEIVKRSWEYLLAGSSPFADPFATLSPAELREIARQVDLPRQIIAAFREHRVVVESVPRRVFVSFASVMNTTVEAIAKALALSPMPELARSYKAADRKPKALPRVSFEQLLIDAGVPAEKRTTIMAADD
jgi:hypothetical protein